MPASARFFRDAGAKASLRAASRACRPIIVMSAFSVLAVPTAVSGAFMVLIRL
jgi:hypothetical protein